jgi:hypothetical protein
VIINEYDLGTFHRVVRIGPVYGIQLPLFIMLMQAHIPVGTEIIVRQHDTADEAERLTFFTNDKQSNV